MSDIFELVQDSKRQRHDLQSAQEKLDQAQQDFKEAHVQQDLKGAQILKLSREMRIEKSDAQREHEVALIDKSIQLEETHFKTKQLESEILKAQGG